MNKMTLGILGTKIGMTRIFGDKGTVLPVTLIQAGPCKIVGIKKKETDGYNAITLGFGEVKEKNLSKPFLGIFNKINLKPCKWLKEFRLESINGYKLGQEIKVDIFKEGDFVDIQGRIKGKGFQGVVKRHNFGGGPRTHGQSDRQRAPGAIGSQRPQRVVKGKKMPGHMGNVLRTVQKLKVIKIVPEKNLLVVKGSVCGPNKNLLVINKTVKKIKQRITVSLEKKIPGKGKAKSQETSTKKK